VYELWVRIHATEPVGQRERVGCARMEVGVERFELFEEKRS
jgi:hypothetical protein